MDKQPRVLALVGEFDSTVDGCTVWRVLQPFTELQKQGYPGMGWDYMDNPLVARIVHVYDAVILPRRHWLPDDWHHGVSWVNAMHKANIAVIYEVDDDMFSDDFVRRLIITHGKDPEAAEQVRRSVLHTIRLIDGVTVSSQRLATILRKYTDKPIRVVPNYIDLPWFTAVQAQAERQVKGLTIGWAGGARPDSDVEAMAIAWGRLAEKFPHVTFVVQGHQAKAIYDNVPNERIAALDWMHIMEYPAGMVNIDIGCCPLADSYFNRAKTYIKAMEYAAGGSAVVASPTVYGQLIEDGRDGYICRTADEWEAALTRLVKSKNKRTDIAQNLLKKIKDNHTLAGNVWRWPLAWSDILADFQRRRTRILIPASAERKRVTV